MGAELIGLDEVLKNLDAKLGPRKVEQASRLAIQNSAEAVKVPIVAAVASYQDTGKEVAGVTVGKVKKIGGQLMIAIGNNGEHWQIVHLNEYGYNRFGKGYHPRGMGKIQTAVNVSQPLYKEAVRARLMGALL